MQNLGQVGGERSVEVEERIPIPIDQVRHPAGKEQTLAQAVVQLDQAVKVETGIAAPGELGAQQGMNGRQGQHQDEYPAGDALPQPLVESHAPPSLGRRRTIWRHFATDWAYCRCLSKYPLQRENDPPVLMMCQTQDSGI